MRPALIVTLLAYVSLLLFTSCKWPWEEGDDVEPETIYGSISYGPTYYATSVVQTDEATFYNLSGAGTAGNGGSFSFEVVVDHQPAAPKEFTIKTGTTIPVHVVTSINGINENLYFGKAGEKIQGDVVGEKARLSFANLTEVDVQGNPTSGSTRQLTGYIQAE